MLAATGYYEAGHMTNLEKKSLSRCARMMANFIQDALHR
jgi:hypothetical protein